jgi:hypothetical protein
VAVAVETVPGGVTLRGRWTVDLTDDVVPDQVYHAVEGRPRAEAVQFVEDAMQVVRRVAVDRVTELSGQLRTGTSIAVGVVTGDRPLTASVAQALAAHPLMHAAEGELYRDALVDAAATLGLAVTAVPRGVADDRLRTDAAGTTVAATVRALGRTAGPPWRKEHKRAAAAALAALDQ